VVVDRIKPEIAAIFVAAALLLPYGCGSEGSRDVAVEPTEPVQAERTVMVADEAPPDEPGDPASGRLLYEKNCHFCHGREGRGDGPVGIAVSPHPADFVGDTERMEKSDEELFESITNGVVKELGGEEMAMPSWKGILTPKERWDLIAYIRYLEKSGKQKEAEGR